MEGMEEEQQLHRGVMDGIRNVENPRPRYHYRHRLIVHGYGRRVNRRSLQHLVDFLDAQQSRAAGVVPVTELVLNNDFRLTNPADGGLQVLQELFSRSDTTLTKVTLQSCDVGSAEEASHLLTAFHTNRTVTDLSIRTIINLRGAALGNSLSDLMQNMRQLHRLDCTGCDLRVEAIPAFQPALQANRTLTELSLWACQIGDEGIRLIADALVGNTTMQALNIGCNYISSNGLDDITRLLESTQLKAINFERNHRLFDDTDATQNFVTTLQLKQSCLQELPGIDEDDFPEDSKIATFASINNSLTRNKQLNRVNLLLAPPPAELQRTDRTSLMMFKTWHKAITIFAKVPNNAGASAIFKLLQARPALLEKRIKRPAAAAATAASQEQKRQRL